jgi:hypothetical protein
MSIFAPAAIICCTSYIFEIYNFKHKVHAEEVIQLSIHSASLKKIDLIFTKLI